MANLAISGGSPTITMGFPAWPMWNETDIGAVNEVVCSGEWEWRGGSKVVEFEKRFAEFQHAGIALTCTNGSTALETVLEALGIGEGDEVIVPDYTFMATAAAPLRRGAGIRLVDVDPGTFCIDTQLIEPAITGKTKAIIPVHFGGHPCDMDQIMVLANEHGLFVIEDCAHAHGAQWQGRHVGTFGNAGMFSFQASKTLSCGEGGAIVSNDANLMTVCRSLLDAGRVVGESVYHHELAGTNHRMNELTAALLVAQLGRLEDQCRQHDENGKLLTDLLAQIDGIKPQSRAPGLTRHGYYLFTFVLEAEVPRAAFKRALVAEGVPVQLEYPAVHTLEFIRKMGADAGKFPTSTRLASRSVWLCHNCLLADEAQIRLIAEAVSKVLANQGELAGVEY